MSLTREDMLRELELLPAWKLNQPLTVSEVPQASPVMAEAPVAQEVEAAPEVAVADWLFVGDVPNFDYSSMGDAATLLDKMLLAIQLQRGKNVHLTPLSEPEYFRHQVALIQPKLIFVFGEQAAQTLLNAQAPLDALRGKVHHYENVALIVSYAPSHLLQHTQDKAKAWADLCLARDTMQSVK